MWVKWMEMLGNFQDSVHYIHSNMCPLRQGSPCVWNWLSWWCFVQDSCCHALWALRHPSRRFTMTGSLCLVWAKAGSLVPIQGLFMEPLEELVRVQECRPIAHLCSNAFMIHHLGNGVRISCFCIYFRSPAVDIWPLELSSLKKKKKTVVKYTKH